MGTEQRSLFKYFCSIILELKLDEPFIKIHGIFGVLTSHRCFIGNFLHGKMMTQVSMAEVSKNYGRQVVVKAKSNP